ncbi:diadenylate cyclase [Haloplanus sp.]|uniref:diadenylate cyclase n=1 Tax=Haloplanus sp. TaxID=1961696 RepID=UPI002636D827|nr:diadenylate cyclase [Haloplanus sp.]
MGDSTNGSDMAALQPNTDGTGAETALDRIKRCVAAVSVEFDRWDDPLARGPGLYFVVERGPSAEFVAPMGTNRWPVENCESVLAGWAAFLRAARSVAFTCDGAAIVRADGTVRETMVRVEQLPAADHHRVDDLQYADWMGARHMSALETSTRRGVTAAVTLSEEDGRVTVFADGTFENVPTEPIEAE